jgi:hypothetical protein
MLIYTAVISINLLITIALFLYRRVLNTAAVALNAQIQQTLQTEKSIARIYQSNVDYYQTLMQFHKGLEEVLLTAKSRYTGTCVAVKNRAAGSPSVYWGPFASIEDVQAWSTSHGVSVGVILLEDPKDGPHAALQR